MVNFLIVIITSIFPIESTDTYQKANNFTTFTIEYNCKKNQFYCENLINNEITYVQMPTKFKKINNNF